MISLRIRWLICALHTVRSRSPSGGHPGRAVKRVPTGSNPRITWRSRIRTRSVRSRLRVRLTVFPDIEWVAPDECGHSRYMSTADSAYLRALQDRRRKQLQRLAEAAEFMADTAEMSARVHDRMAEHSPGAAERARRERQLAAAERDAAKAFRAGAMPSKASREAIRASGSRADAQRTEDRSGQAGTGPAGQPSQDQQSVDPTRGLRSPHEQRRP